VRRRVHGGGGVHDVGRDGEQVDRLLGQRPGLVEPGQQQQVLDEQPHPRGLVLDAPQDLRELLGVACGALPEQLGEAADGRQRGPQLVAGVGDEASHAPLGRARLDLGALLRGVGALEPVDHDVEGRRQAADLGARVGGRHPDAEVPGGDRLRGALDVAQRPQAAPHRQRRQHADAAERRRADGAVDDQ
jgi:hypothetical protein